MHLPSSRRKKRKLQKLNLAPILDATFIFIFFLLMSANFIKIFEIGSDVPMISDQEPPKNDRPPLALTLTIDESKISVLTGVPSKTVKTINRDGSGFYNLEELHSFLVSLKQNNPSEKMAIFEPVVDLTYEELIKIMDEVRILRNTDPSIYRKDKAGIDVKVPELFDNIVFGNIQS